MVKKRISKTLGVEKHGDLIRIFHAGGFTSSLEEAEKAGTLEIIMINKSEAKKLKKVM